MSQSFRTMQIVVLKVNSKDDLGRPKEVTMIYDEEKVDVSNPKNREFITAMIEPKLIAPKTKARG